MEYTMIPHASCNDSGSDTGINRQQSIDEAFELLNSLHDFNERSGSLYYENPMQAMPTGSDAANRYLSKLDSDPRYVISPGRLIHIYIY